MGIATATGSLAAGESRTFYLAPASTVTLVAPPNTRATVTETPATVTASGVGGDAKTHKFDGMPRTVTYGPYAMGGAVVVQVLSNSGATVAWTETSAVFSKNTSGSITGLVGPDGVVSPLLVPHPRYWFHGCATLQAADDGVFRDMVAGNNGAFGANLSRAQAWANRASGYISTVNPVGGSTDSVIRIPGPNFDYANGQSLLIYWCGQCTPEGSDSDIMGTSNNTSQNGVRVRANSSGRLSFVLYDTAPTSGFSSTSSDDAAGKPFVAGECHSFALFIDGQKRQQSFWIDEQVNISQLQLNSGNNVNTLSSAAWSIGTATPTGGTNGIATKTSTFVGLKFLATDTLPTVGAITDVLRALRRDPSGIILAGAL